MKKAKETTRGPNTQSTEGITSCLTKAVLRMRSSKRSSKTRQERREEGYQAQRQEIKGEGNKIWEIQEEETYKIKEEKRARLGLRKSDFQLDNSKTFYFRMKITVS